MARTVFIAFILSICALTVFSQKSRFVTVISENATLRGNPSSSREIIGIVVVGEVFRLVEIRGAWSLVQTPNYVGWLHGSTLTLGNIRMETITKTSYARNDAPYTIQSQPIKVKPPPRVETTRPDSGTVMADESYSTGLGYLTISNGTDNDAIAKLVDLRIRKSYREVYIQANSSFTIQEIAVGSYELLFSLGNGYAPSLDKCLLNASCSKFDSVIEFTETKEDIGNSIRTNYDSYRLTLNKVVGGNAASSSISEAEFVKY